MCADLYGMGLLHALISHLDRPEAEVRTAAFWALGTAAANNPDAQAHQLFSPTFSFSFQLDAAARRDSGCCGVHVHAQG